MALYDDDYLQISRRLKDALISDIVLDDLSPEADELLARRLRSWELSGHLARHLGLGYDWRGTAGLEATMVFMLSELDDLLRTWPPIADIERCRSIAHAATAGLTTLEVVTTLLLGPKEWQRAKVGAGTVGALGAQLRPVLEERLAAEMLRMLERWTKDDVRNLRTVRAKAVEAAEREDAERQRLQRLAATPMRERPKREDRPRPGAYFDPPPRI